MFWLFCCCCAATYARFRAKIYLCWHYSFLLYNSIENKLGGSGVGFLYWSTTCIKLEGHCVCVICSQVHTDHNVINKLYNKDIVVSKPPIVIKDYVCVPQRGIMFINVNTKAVQRESRNRFSWPSTTSVLYRHQGPFYKHDLTLYDTGADVLSIKPLGKRKLLKKLCEYAVWKLSVVLFNWPKRPGSASIHGWKGLRGWEKMLHIWRETREEKPYDIS